MNLVNKRDRKRPQVTSYVMSSHDFLSFMDATMIFVTIIAIHNSKSVVESTIVFVKIIVTKNKGPLTMKAFLVHYLTKASRIRQFQQSIIAITDAFYLSHPEHRPSALNPHFYPHHSGPHFSTARRILLRRQIVHSSHSILPTQCTTN